jgi:hypothetical protein
MCTPFDGCVMLRGAMADCGWRWRMADGDGGWRWRMQRSIGSIIGPATVLTIGLNVTNAESEGVRLAVGGPSLTRST